MTTKEEIETLHRLYLQIWKERVHFSEVSKKYLGWEPRSTLFHHILPKNRWKEAIYDGENIILLTQEEHTKVEGNPSFYEEINRRREKLKKKYGKNNKK